MVFVLGHRRALSSDSLESVRTTLRKSFRWKPMENSFWFMASGNRCIVADTIALSLEKLFPNPISIYVHGEG